jgi:hypothetical protein
MKKRILWMLVSCLMVLSLLIASCGQKEEKEAKVTEEEEGVVITTEKATEKEVVTEKTAVVPSDTPQYGGTINLALAFDISNWANGLEFC